MGQADAVPRGESLGGVITGVGLGDRGTAAVSFRTRRGTEESHDNEWNTSRTERENNTELLFGV